MDSSEVDKAVIGVLTADAALMALMPGGVWWDLADAASHFVIVSGMDHADEYAMPGRTLQESFLYLVKAVTKGASGSDVKAAALRIDQLLDNRTLYVPGYHPSNCLRRVKRERFTELDESTNERWQHRGGRYEVRITPQ